MKGNKGDWSEFYVLVKLLADGELARADENLEKLTDYIYPIEKIIRSHQTVTHSYKVESGLIQISIGNDIPISLKIEEFTEAARLIFERIKSTSGVFDIPDINEFIKSIRCPSLKAGSLEKADLHVVIHDHRTGLNPKLGFSVKSQTGSSATLMNAAKTTNFLYKVNGISLDRNEVDRINDMTVAHSPKKKSVKERVNEIVRLGGELSFHDVVNPIFKGNLSLIDSQLPEIMANLTKDYFNGNGVLMSELVEQIEVYNPVGYDSAHGHEFYKYKIKRLLTDVALGMLPSKVWDGQFEANGGFIVLKQDGEILCYHLYEKDLFENYLFKNTKIDTPSSSRHDYGYLFRVGDDVFIRLCLQIRFTT